MVNENQNEKKWKTIDPQVWTYEKEGECIEGVLLDKQADVGVNKSKLYTIETTKGSESVWGSTVLDQRMNIVKVGDAVRITYKGLEKNKRGQDVKIFKVEVAE